MARGNLEGITHKTPIKLSSSLSEIVGNNLMFKTECFQKTGSFKFRGAYNKLFSNKNDFAGGVVTASAGNHAQGVALAAKKLNLPSTVVMPDNAPIPKVAATKSYGSEIVLEGDIYDDAFRKAIQFSKEKGKAFIPAFDDYDVMAGQGTIALEILADIKAPDIIMVPVGGGGLISGLAVGIKENNPGVKIIGIQSEEVSPAVKILKEKTEARPKSQGARSIADGITVKNPGQKNIPIIKKYVDDMITVKEEEIAEAILLILERSKIMVEGAGAVGLAALLKSEMSFKGKNVVVILSGGNIDVNMISRIIQRGLARSGRITRLHTVILDVPGALKEVLELVSKTGANVLSIHHVRQDPRLPLGMVGIDLDLETRDEKHIEELISYLHEKGYNVYNR